jgi:hypothetical protein
MSKIYESAWADPAAILPQGYTATMGSYPTVNPYVAGDSYYGYGTLGAGSGLTYDDFLSILNGTYKGKLSLADWTAVNNYKNTLKLTNSILEKNDSWTTKYLEPFAKGVDAFATLGNLFLGFKQYGIAKQQLGIAKEQWKYTKEELERIRKVREKANKKFLGEE